jgi:hypothetical protein
MWRRWISKQGRYVCKPALLLLQSTVRSSRDLRDLPHIRRRSLISSASSAAVKTFSLSSSAFASRTFATRPSGMCLISRVVVIGLLRMQRNRDFRTARIQSSKTGDSRARVPPASEPTLPGRTPSLTGSPDMPRPEKSHFSKAEQQCSSCFPKGPKELTSCLANPIATNVRLRPSSHLSSGKC